MIKERPLMFQVAQPEDLETRNPSQSPAVQMEGLGPAKEPTASHSLKFNRILDLGVASLDFLLFPSNAEKYPAAPKKQPVVEGLELHRL